MSKRPTETRREVRGILGAIYDDLESLYKRVDNLENGGRSARYILIQDQKTSGTAGGTFTTGSWQTRVLNTKVSDVNTIATLASNQITLPIGVYRFQASAPAYRVGAHQARLFNVTAAAVIALGSSEYCDPVLGINDATRSLVMGRFVLSAASVIELQHRCGSTQATDGLGRPGSWGTEVYAVIELWRE